MVQGREGEKMGEVTVTNVTEYQAIAKQKLPKMIYDYYASGAEDEWTLQENREAFARILCVRVPFLFAWNLFVEMRRSSMVKVTV